MDLTISILIYDNEQYVNYVNRLLNSINKNLKNYKTLLLIDDRRNQNISLDKIFDLNKFNYEIIKHGENKGILQGYLSSMEYSKTDWLWILDMDDEVTSFDFDTIYLKNNADIIYFTKSYNNMKRDYENVPNAEIFIDNKFFKILGKSSFEFEQIFKETKSNSINLIVNNLSDKYYLYYNYEFFFLPVYEKILNVNYCKKYILRNDFSKFGKFNFSADILIGLIIYDNLKSILVINEGLPYIHYHYNSEKYFPTIYRNGMYIPNTNVSKEVKQSWDILNEYLNDILYNKYFKILWIRRLVESYAYSGLDFTKYNTNLKKEDTK